MTFSLLAQHALVRMKRTLGPDQSDPAPMHRNTVEAAFREPAHRRTPTRRRRTGGVPPAPRTRRNAHEREAVVAEAEHIRHPERSRTKNRTHPVQASIGYPAVPSMLAA